MKKHVTKLLPISIVDGDYCKDMSGECIHCDSLLPRPRCDLGLTILTRDKYGDILKPPDCRSLDEPRPM